MATDPFANTITTIGPPYDNAYSVDLDALVEGDIDLPFTTSALWIATTKQSLVRVVTAGGQTVDIRTGDTQLIELRVVRILQAETDPDDLRPYCLIGMW